MKLLLDENLSYRIVKKIKAVFIGSEHISSLGLKGQADRQIWNLAKQEDFTIVTYDEDYFELTQLMGFPPKVIWLRNMKLSNQGIAMLLLSKQDDIIKFMESDACCLEIY